MRWALVLAITALMGMGVGGGGLLVLAMVLLFDISQRTAQGINLAAFVVSAASSMLIHLRRRRVNARLFLGIIPGCLGAFLGVHLATKLPEELLRTLLGALLVAGGVLALWAAFRENKGEKEGKTKK